METVRAVVYRALGIAGGVAATLLLLGFLLGWCARAVHGQEAEKAVIVGQRWCCSVSAGKDVQDKRITWYYTRGWLQIEHADGTHEELKKRLVAVRKNRREALLDCDDYLTEMEKQVEDPERSRRERAKR